MFMKPFRQGYANAERNHYQSRTKRKEGELSVDYNPKKKKLNDNGVGEYVDYEEVD